jgi:hypothetical protein
MRKFFMFLMVMLFLSFSSISFACTPGSCGHNPPQCIGGECPYLGVIPYVVTDGNWWTGVVLTNDSTEEATYKLLIYTRAGDLLIKEYVVDPHGQEIFVLPFNGYVKVNVDNEKCYCLVLLGNPNQLISYSVQFEQANP